MVFVSVCLLPAPSVIDVVALSFAPFVRPSFRAAFESVIVILSDLPGFNPAKDLLPAVTDLLFFLTLARTLSDAFPRQAVFALARQLIVTTADLPLTPLSEAIFASATAAGLAGGAVVGEPPPVAAGGVTTGAGGVGVDCAVQSSVSARS